MREVLSKINTSFKKASRGEETLTCMIWWWGAISYLLAYFFFNKLILLIDVDAIDVLISILMVAYFLWHIVATKKCSPKKPKLTPEEKRKLKEERRHNFNKSVVKKLLLQEPLTEWDSGFMVVMIDLLCITHFLSYILRG